MLSKKHSAPVFTAWIYRYNRLFGQCFNIPETENGILRILFFWYINLSYRTSGHGFLCCSVPSLSPVASPPEALHSWVRTLPTVELSKKGSDRDDLYIQVFYVYFHGIPAFHRTIGIRRTQGKRFHRIIKSERTRLVCTLLRMELILYILWFIIF